MPTARRSRMIAASEHELWEVIRDPHHLPRWWPRVTRVENVEGGEFTEVMKTSKGKLVRADFLLVESEQAIRAVRWEQLVQGTPFARLLRSAVTEVRLEPVASEPAVGLLPTPELEPVASEPAVESQPRRTREPAAAPATHASVGSPGLATSPWGATEVTIEVSQTLNGFFPRFGGYMVRRAAAETIEEALDGLERISG